MGPAKLCVEVVYALAEPDVRIVHLKAGSIVLDAIRESGLLQDYPAINMRVQRVGIFGRFVGLTDPVKARDRVEIYAPLPEDPKTARRKRARLKSGRARKYGAVSAVGYPRYARACRV